MFNEMKVVNETELTKQKIDGIKSSFLSVLDNYKKYYVFYNANPNVEEYQKSYFEAKNQLSSLAKELTDIIFRTYNKINNLNDESSQLYKNINENRVEYGILNNKVQNLKNVDQGSKILINDYKQKYNDQFYYNLELFLGILLVGGILKSTFSQ